MNCEAATVNLPHQEYRH